MDCRGTQQAYCRDRWRAEAKRSTTFQWLNTILGNVKTGSNGTYHTFNFNKYSDHYLAEIAYRFNRRFNQKTLPQRLLIAGLACPLFPDRLLRSTELCC